MTELRTARLELRRWREADLDEYAAIAADPEVTRYLGGPPFDREQRGGRSRCSSDIAS